jgi:hypothetical protein
VQFIPLPTTREYLIPTAPIWGPFLWKQARHEGRDPRELLEEVWDGGDDSPPVTQLHLIRDEETRHVPAVLATQVTMRGDKRVGVLHWISGGNPKAWLHLIPEGERYLREHLGCIAVTGTPRKGWARAFKRHGYTISPHPTNPRLVRVEKDLLK